MVCTQLLPIEGLVSIMGLQLFSKMKAQMHFPVSSLGQPSEPAVVAVALLFEGQRLRRWQVLKFQFRPTQLKVLLKSALALMLYRCFHRLKIWYRRRFCRNLASKGLLGPFSLLVPLRFYQQFFWVWFEPFDWDFYFFDLWFHL